MTDVCTCRTIALSGWDTVQEAVDPTCPVHKPKWTDLFGIDPNYLEGVPEEPTLTAAEVKVLTETASKVAYALGRKDASEHIAEAMDSYPGDGQISTKLVAMLARTYASQAAGATSEATSGVPGPPEAEAQVVTLDPVYCADGCGRLAEREAAR